MSKEQSATSRPNTLAELFASWGPDHTISPHEPRAFNKLASRYSDLLQLVHRLEDAPGSAGRAGSHLDMAKAPGPSPQYNVVEGCAMMPGPFTSPSETVPNGYKLVRADVLEWLHGEREHPDTGEWFIRPEDRQGAFWWRRELREATINAAPAKGDLTTGRNQQATNPADITGAAPSFAPSARVPNDCPFCGPKLYANPANTRAEAAPSLDSTRKKCQTCPYFTGCMVGDCDNA